jgi:hypothetical protein
MGKLTPLTTRLRTSLIIRSYSGPFYAVFLGRPRFSESSSFVHVRSQFNLSHMLYTISSRYILILSYHLRQVLTTKIFSRGFPIKILYFCLGIIILPRIRRQQLYANR